MEDKECIDDDGDPTALQIFISDVGNTHFHLETAIHGTNHYHVFMMQDIICESIEFANASATNFFQLLQMSGVQWTELTAEQIAERESRE